MKQKNKYLPKYEIKIENLSNKEKQEFQNIKEKLIQLKINKNIQINKEELLNLIDENIEDPNKIINKLTRELHGYGKIDYLLKDDELEEIMIIGTKKPVYVYHRKKGMMITNLSLDDYEIRHIIEKIAQQVQRKIDQQTPILDARLTDGSRVNATIPPISADGPTLTIRKFKKDPLTIIDLIESNTLSSHLAAFLWIITEGLNVNPCNYIIAGGTGSGKTTTLNTLTSFIPPHERIITIEDTLEIQIAQNHIIRMETRPPNIENKGEITMDLLLKNSLRQRPDRIIVGEVRSHEAITLFTALNTGHSGMGTLHSNTTRETISRLINPPMNVPNIMITSLNFIIMQNRIHQPKQGTIRRITEVAEIVGMEENKLQLNKIYQYDTKEDRIKYIAITCNSINKIAEMKGLSNIDIMNELEKREMFLNKLVEKQIKDIDKVQEIINGYYDDPYKTINRLNNKK